MNDSRATYEAMGRAALLPGIQYAVEQMQRMLDDMREALAGLQNGHAPKRVGRPRKSETDLFELRKKNASANPRGYWAKMTPEERSAEMARRMALGRKRKGEKEQAGKMPLKVGDEYTQAGVAQELGFSHAHSYRNWRVRLEREHKVKGFPRGRSMKLAGFNGLVRMFSESDLDALRKIREEVAKR